MNQFDEFEALFRESIGEDPIGETRKKMRRFIDFMRSQEWHREQLESFAQYRKLSPEILEEAESFMFRIKTLLPTEFCSEDLAVHSFEGRYCYPVKTANGEIAGLLGYEAFDLPKYLDSKTMGYKAKSGIFFGMENIADYYRSTEPVIFVEGSVCALTLRDHGFQALAYLGSYLTPYFITVMKRFGRRCIVMPDSDEAGSTIVRQVGRSLPMARVVRVTSAKDIDDSRQKNPDFFTNLRRVISNPFVTLPL